MSDHLSSKTGVPDNSKVICPNCCHQFAAICVDDQKERSARETEIERLRAALEGMTAERDAALAHFGLLTTEIARLERQLIEEQDRNEAHPSVSSDDVPTPPPNPPEALGSGLTRAAVETSATPAGNK